MPAVTRVCASLGRGSRQAMQSPDLGWAVEKVPRYVIRVVGTCQQAVGVCWGLGGAVLPYSAEL